jgi:TonB family protein
VNPRIHRKTGRQEDFLKSFLSSRLPVLFFWALLLVSLPASAQQPQQPQQQPQPQQPPLDRGDVSVPRGEGGVILKPQPGQPPPPAAGKATAPRPLNYTPPRYPAAAEKAGIEGSVTLQLDIDKAGKVTKATVVDPAGHGFDEAAVEAALKLEFEPARRPDGSPVATRILYRYAFTLKTAEPTGPPTTGPSTLANGALRGRVFAPGDAPIAGATIKLTGPIERSGTTNERGEFDFADLPPGPYVVNVTAAGFETVQVTEDVAKGERTELVYRLIVRGGGLEVTIRGTKPPREVTKRTLEQREISRIPGTNGDALRSLQSLPGVARPPAILGVLLVRGSGPQDTQAFIDGSYVPIIYHFGGLSSVVPTEMLEKIDFYPGNFSAQYGRVMGGIVDVGIRSPKEDGKYHGLVQVDLIDARALLEGPIPLLKGFSFIAAGRRSYVDAWLGLVLEAAGAGVTQAPVYYDYQFLVENHPSRDSRFRVSFFGSDDALALLINQPSQQEPALTGNIGLHTAFQRLQVKFDSKLAPGQNFTGVAALGKDNVDFGLGPFYFLLEVLSVSGRLELSSRLSKEATLNVGTDVGLANFTVALRAPAPPRPGAPPNQPFSTRNVRELSQEGSAIQPAAYAELELTPSERARVTPGLRVDYFNVNEHWDVSPRVNGRYDIVHDYPRTTAKGGVGLFHQPPAFQEVLPDFGNPSLTSNRAIHYAVGMEQELTRHIEVSVEGFFKQLDRLVTTRASATGATSIDYANDGTGYVIGSEVLLKYKPDDRFFGWLAYTLSRSVRTDHPGDESHLVPFDQTHILTVLGSYQLGHGWEFGARFRLVSGNLVTPNVCNFLDETCDPTRTNSLYHAASGAYTPIPLTRPYSERLPMFHSLDLRIDKRWKFKSWQLSAYLDVQNAYNHGNAEAIEYNFNYTSRRYITGLPVLPSLGLRADF